MWFITFVKKIGTHLFLLLNVSYTLINMYQIEPGIIIIIPGSFSFDFWL